MSALTDVVDWATGSNGRHELDVTRPQPVLDEAKAKASAAAAITTVVTAAAALGVSTTDAGLLGLALTVLAGAVIAIANAALTLRAAYAARPQVTPLSDPRDADGNQLVAALPDPGAPTTTA